MTLYTFFYVKNVLHFVELDPKVKWRKLKVRNERTFRKADKLYLFKKANVSTILVL